MSNTNETRAVRASEALRNYVEAKGEAFENSSSEAADLIADLLHLVARIDEGDEPVESTLRLARLHFDAEHGNPEEEEIPASATSGSSGPGDLDGAVSSLDGMAAAP